MAQIILDFASATTCKNDKDYIKRMIDELAEVDSRKHEVVIKWQLFEKALEVLDPIVEPLRQDLFKWAHYYAELKDYKTTASVFDLPSLKHLLEYDIPFVKLANRPDLYWLAGEVPRRVPVYKSVHWGGVATITDKEKTLCCISKYPAEPIDYIADFTPTALSEGISDHTTDFALYYLHKPKIIEWHYKLEDSTGWDAGKFARTPKQLREIL